MALNLSVVIEQTLIGKAKSAQVLTLSASSARSTILAPGLYRVISTQPCWILQGTSGVTAVAATSIYLPANAEWLLPIGDSATEGYVAAIEHNGSAGYLCISPRS